MREVEEREIRSYKCPMCGSRNKLVYDICYIVKERVLGYHYRCCNCGKETVSTNPDINIESLPAKNVVRLNPRCYIVTGCKNYNCQFNNRKDKPINYPDNNFGDGVGNNNGNMNGSGITNCGCNNNCNINLLKNKSKSVSPIQLTVNAPGWDEYNSSCDKYR